MQGVLYFDFSRQLVNYSFEFNQKTTVFPQARRFRNLRNGFTLVTSHCSEGTKDQIAIYFESLFKLRGVQISQTRKSATSCKLMSFFVVKTREAI